jgi:hypothetical protein
MASALLPVNSSLDGLVTPTAARHREPRPGATAEGNITLFAFEAGQVGAPLEDFSRNAVVR